MNRIRYICLRTLKKQAKVTFAAVAAISLFAALLLPVSTVSAATTANLVDVGGGINCNGDPFAAGAVVGTVTAQVTGGNLVLDFDMNPGGPNASYSTEVFEATTGCSSDDGAATGQNIPGVGTGQVVIALPHPTLAGETLGDGVGSEDVVVVLDFANSGCGCGDAYVAKFALADAAATPDVTAPTVTLNTPADGAVYQQGQVVNADYTCEDELGGSGLASCVGDVPTGSPINTLTLGVHTFTVNAVDNENNPTSTAHNYTVQLATPPSKDACKNDGWKNYGDTNGSPFKNQGQCISFVNQP